MSYTKGPWAVSLSKEIGAETIGPEDGFNPIGGCGCCGSPWINGDTEEEQKANARLIVSAPRMVAALQRAAHILAEIDQATAPAVLALRSEIVATIKEATPEYYGS